MALPCPYQRTCIIIKLKGMSINKRTVLTDAQSYQIQAIGIHISKVVFCTYSYQLTCVIT
jgi:hypothetical protein